VLKRSFELIWQGDLKEMKPFAFYTDGGTYHFDPKYFLQCIWNDTNALHSTVVHVNAHITSIISKNIDFNVQSINPKEHVVKGTHDKVFRI